MPQYCDSAKLEHNWFNWLVASSVPDLELYRQRRLLWTKIIGQTKDNDGKVIVKNGKTFKDATYPIKLHCIATSMPIYFQSNAGEVPCKGILFGEELEVDLPSDIELSLDSDSQIHCLDNDLFCQQETVIPRLIEQGYQQEEETNYSWQLMLEDINRMCLGIATKFNQSSEDETTDLANEALLQVMNKLKGKKLVYIAGRAPVFNLLTTTIYRCMFSIMNRRKTQRNGLYKILDEMKGGVLPDEQRNFRAQTKHRVNNFIMR